MKIYARGRRRVGVLVMIVVAEVMGIGKGFRIGKWFRIGVGLGIGLRSRDRNMGSVWAGLKLEVC